MQNLQCINPAEADRNRHIRKREDSRDRTQESGHRNQEPETRTQKPGHKSQEEHIMETNKNL